MYTYHSHKALGVSHLLARALLCPILFVQACSLFLGPPPVQQHSSFTHVLCLKHLLVVQLKYVKF